MQCPVSVSECQAVMYDVIFFKCHDVDKERDHKEMGQLRNRANQTLATNGMQFNYDYAHIVLDVI